MKRVSLTFAALVTTALALPAHASLLYPDFSSTAGLTLNGNSTTLDNGIDPNTVLRLAAATTSQTGSVFTTSAVDVSEFTTTFEFRISDSGGATDASGQEGADGITFTIQGVGGSALGGGGGGLGYDGISPSVAVEFDTWLNPFDPDSNHIGINQDGSLSSLVTAAVPGEMNDSTLQTATISYDGTTLTAMIGGTSVGLALDLASILGDTTAYVGFTGATGGAFGNHDLISWSYETPTAETPVPSTLPLLAVGTLLLAYARRRRAY